MFLVLPYCMYEYLFRAGLYNLTKVTKLERNIVDYDFCVLTPNFVLSTMLQDDV